VKQSMSPTARRKSIDSSDSEIDTRNQMTNSNSNYPQDSKTFGQSSGYTGGMPQEPGEKGLFSHHQQAAPPSYTPPAPPPSGYRLPLSTSSQFPTPQHLGQAPCYDLDGTSPVYLGSALFEKSVHPCKIGPHLNPPCSVPYGGQEFGHHGRYDLLPFTPETMEFVRTSEGRIPAGRRPVEGGYEENGEKLYHAVGLVNGVRVPGKTGSHLGGCNVAFGGREHIIRENYDILCWRY